MTDITYEKQFGIKDAIRIISSLNISQKLLVSTVLRLANPFQSSVAFYIENPQACNFIKKETLAEVFSCEFCRISKNTFFTEHLWTIALESLNSCWVPTTYKILVDKLYLVEVTNQFCFENEHRFSIFRLFKNKDFPRKFTECAAVGT